jgi:hypothetical protein
MAVVAFDSAEFKAEYPEFTASDAVLNRCFKQAELILNNTDYSVVKNVDERKTLLYLLTAHIALISVGLDGKGGSGVVGAIASATEGTVSVSVSQAGVTVNSAWYQQSQYGAMYWMMTAKYRTARYIPGRSYPEPRRRFGIINR